MPLVTKMPQHVTSPAREGYWHDKGDTKITFTCAHRGPAAIARVVDLVVVEARAGWVGAASGLCSSDRDVLERGAPRGRAFGACLFCVRLGGWRHARHDSFDVCGSRRDVEVPAVVNSGVGVVHRKAFVVLGGEIKELDSGRFHHFDPGSCVVLLWVPVFVLIPVPVLRGYDQRSWFCNMSYASGNTI